MYIHVIYMYIHIHMAGTVAGKSETASDYALRLTDFRGDLSDMLAREAFVLRTSTRIFRAKIFRGVTFRCVPSLGEVPPLQHKISDGIGTPDPNPGNLVNWCSNIL